MNVFAPAVRALLSEAVDYAGLFPPAGLPMQPVVDNFATYCADPAAWMLGRLIVPAARLDEFASALRAQPAAAGAGWRLSVLMADPARELALLEHVAGLDVLVDTVELRASAPAAIPDLLRELPAGLTPYVELPLDSTLQASISTLASHGARAKIRMGGVTVPQFPSVDQVLEFLLLCVEAGVPFKATAGLHHPLRGDYRLTYADGSPHGTMFGFLNVFVASAGLATGWDAASARAMLLEHDPATLTATSASLRWQAAPGRTLELGLDDLTRARRTTSVAFGSCSFTEPRDELAQVFAQPMAAD